MGTLTFKFLSFFIYFLFLLLPFNFFFNRKKNLKNNTFSLCIQFTYIFYYKKYCKTTYNILISLGVLFICGVFFDKSIGLNFLLISFILVKFENN